MADMAWSPMSIEPPSPAITMMLGNSPCHFPLRISTLYAASIPEATAPPLVIWVCIQGTWYGVQR